jgi:hypothetical protein
MLAFHIKSYCPNAYFRLDHSVCTAEEHTKSILNPTPSLRLELREVSGLRP